MKFFREFELLIVSFALLLNAERVSIKNNVNLTIHENKDQCFEKNDCFSDEEVLIVDKTECLTETFITAPNDVFSLPDIHGDINGLIRALKAANAIDNDNNWIGGNLVIVQTGDIFDRGPDTFQIIELIMKLTKQSVSAGGCLVSLLGNHEFMNLQHDFRYASAKETAGFGGKDKRLASLSLVHPIGEFLRNLRMSVVIRQKNTSSLFVHAGLEPRILTINKVSLKEMNLLVQDTLRKHSGMELTRKIYSDRKLYEIFGNSGPIWSRYFSLSAPDDDDYGAVCKNLGKTLNMVKADRMIVGHTVQPTFMPGFKCGKKLVLTDVGMSSFYGGGKHFIRIQATGVLEIIS